jgi:predicted dehydrogenase
MGKGHLKSITSLENAELVSLCDIKADLAEKLSEEHGVPSYTDYHDCLNPDQVDGIIIATPHYDHPVIAAAAFKKGIHVLSEKPIAVHKADAERMITAYKEGKKRKPDLLFSAMFQMRTSPLQQKIKELISSGTLGTLMRATWIITSWYRTQYYYDHGDWRATWKGEGGGVLLNQCPHQLDLYQWFFGLPSRVQALGYLGKYHHIEVEDEISGTFEHENGMTGHFITTTAESPGTNRLEIAGDLGKLVSENGKLILTKNSMPVSKHRENADSGFSKIETTTEEVPYDENKSSGHAQVIKNFCDVVLKKSDLNICGTEGIRSVELGNTMLYSAMKKTVVPLPLDGAEYEDFLKGLIAGSRFQKRSAGSDEAGDFDKSFQK